MPRQTVLVIEDDEAVRQSIVTALEAEDYDVRSAADGESGLALARDASPALILADYHMPHVDGIGLLKEIRDDEALKDVPFVFITVDPTLEMRRTAARAGIHGFLVKPFNMEDLLTTVQDMFRRQ